MSAPRNACVPARQTVRGASPPPGGSSTLTSAPGESHRSGSGRIFLRERSAQEDIRADELGEGAARPGQGTAPLLSPPQANG